MRRSIGVLGIPYPALEQQYPGAQLAFSKLAPHLPFVFSLSSTLGLRLLRVEPSIKSGVAAHLLAATNSADSLVLPTMLGRLLRLRAPTLAPAKVKRVDKCIAFNQDQYPRSSNTHIDHRIEALFHKLHEELKGSSANLKAGIMRTDCRGAGIKRSPPGQIL